MCSRRWSSLLHPVLATGLLVALAIGCGASAPDPTGTTAPATGTTPTTVTTTTPGATTAPGYPAGPQTISLVVDGVTRTAVLVVPADRSRPAPLVFAFHGHGGSGRNLDRKMDLDGLWPDAVVVYPDGLVGHQGRTDPAGEETGWQSLAGESGDQDLRFYDALIADLRAKLPVDPDRIYAVGHSNGSAFVSLLLDERGDDLAATANLSGQPGRHLETDPVRSMFLSMGRADPIVPYANQVRSVPLAEQKVGADPTTKVVDGDLMTERGRGNLELAVYDHPGGHEVPDAVPALIVAFFQRHTLSGG